MAFKDLREWIEKLESEGELKRVKAKVDWNLELAEIVRKVYSKRGPALIFENIKDHENTRCKKFFTGSLATRSRFALMFNLPKESPREKIISVIRERLTQPLKPLLIKTGPVKENIVMGNDIDLFQFPVPKYHPLDGGRYIDTFCGVVTKDPDTGMTNVGLYRGMIVSKNKILSYLIFANNHPSISILPSISLLSLSYFIMESSSALGAALFKISKAG
jgi:4-hydroxy-3-polyprenylbenzoate decarboxylase